MKLEKNRKYYRNCSNNFAADCRVINLFIKISNYSREKSQVLPQVLE